MYRLAENMMGIRLAIYIIITTSIFVFFCLYGCFIVIVNRFEIQTEYRSPDADRKEQRKKVLTEGLKKLTKKYEPLSQTVKAEASA